MSAQEYAERLKYYLNKIETQSRSIDRLYKELQKSYDDNYMSLLMQASNWALTKNRSANDIDKYIKFKNASLYLEQARKDIPFQQKINNFESAMKKTYKIIDELRYEMTGERTTYRVAVAVGGSKRGRLYEVDLPLQEVLNAAKLTAAWTKGKDIKSGLALQLKATAAKKAQWVKDYQSIDITDSYNYFVQNNDMTMISKKNKIYTLNEGRKFELYRLAKLRMSKNYQLEGQTTLFNDYDTNLIKLDSSVLQQLKQQVTSDNVSFVRGVDSAYMFGGESYYESLKSFIGGDPGLANFDTLYNTLGDLRNIMSNYIYHPEQLQKQLQDQMEQQQQSQKFEQMSMDFFNTVQEQVVPQQVNALFQDIFPAAIMSGF